MSNVKAQKNFGLSCPDFHRDKLQQESISFGKTPLVSRRSLPRT